MKKLLCFFWVLLTCFNAFGLGCTPKNCMIVIDAGSTGSRAYLYTYQFDNKNTPLAINSLLSKKNNPGIAGLANSKESVHEYLDNLLSDMPIDSTSKLPVYFYATAGMRLLAVDHQQTLYHHIEQWFDSHDGYKLIEAKTISGKDEGLYGWLAANYLSGTFQKGVRAEQTGMIDFGGASIQIALALDKQQKTRVDSSDLTTINIADRTYHVYSKSFLGLGLTEMTKQFLTNQKCFTTNYPLPSDSLGQGDAYQCEQDVEVLSNAVHKVNEIKVLNLVNQTSKWMALGALGYLHNTKPFNGLGASFNMKTVMNVAQSGVCQVGWKDLKSQDPNNPYLYNACLASAYYYAIAVEGYGLKENTVINTTLPNTNDTPDWTVGVVMMRHS